MRPLALLAPAAATLVLAALPAAASAGTVSLKAGTVTFTAAAGEVNDLSVTRTEDALAFADPGAPITAGPECTQTGTHKASCPLPDVGAVARLGDRDDKGRSTAGALRLEGGTGDDELTDGSGSSRLYGGPGDDELSCADGGCEMRGGIGADYMRGAPQTNLPGGIGRVSYDDHPDGVTLTVDGIADDGNASDGPVGERDNVVGVDVIEGSPGDDNLSDGAQPVSTPEYQYVHLIYGLGGDDEIYGLGGNDLISAGRGTDVLVGGSGDDGLWPDGDRGLAGESGWGAGDVASGGTGTDTVLYDRSASVRVSLNGVADDGTGTEGDNVRIDVENVSMATGLAGGDGDDVIVGNNGPNLLGGGGGEDSISGGAGADEIHGARGADTLSGGAGDDVLTGGRDSDYFLNPGAGDPDLISGGSGSDEVSGHRGNDLLDGGLGADVLSGGDGSDTVTYETRTGPIIVSMSGGANDGADVDLDGFADEGDDVRVDVENLVGGAGDDMLFGNSSANRLNGGSGGRDQLRGNDGNDVLEGEDGTTPDLLAGGADDDRMLQGKYPDGGDTIDGGTGTDTVDYSARIAAVAVTLDDVVRNDGDVASDERDLVYGDVEAVLGGVGADVLTGADIDNLLAGGGGDDILDGGFGADELVGGFGVDTVTYASRTGAVTADLDGLADDGTSADANASAVRDRIRTDVERLIGGAGPDTLSGNAAPNRLTGGGGADVLTGGGAVDGLFGGNGDDRLFSRGDGAADTAACEGGVADEVTADAADTTSGCEVVH